MTPTRRSANNPFGGEHDYLRMLREAQRESNRSSSKVSPISSAFISGKTSPNGSPKSPPNTPNHELATSLHEELKAVYINHFVRPDEVHGELTASDIMWDWSSKPNIPCKYVLCLWVILEFGNWECVFYREWTFATIRSRKSSSSSKISSSNNSKDLALPNDKKRTYLERKKVFLTVLITNFVSFLIGAGIG